MNPLRMTVKSKTMSRITENDDDDDGVRLKS